MVHSAVAVRSGIIPARAGFTRSRRTRPAGTADHPRSRGVYHADGVPAGGPQGSSPLARGLPSKSVMRSFRDRIIPARAGFTGRCASTPRGAADHPRSRGVYDPLRPLAGGLHGSSPLARGLPEETAAFRLARRIIPARAGFTGAPSCTGGVHRDHPRSRGVYTRTPGRWRHGDGSSPLARGLRQAGDHAPRAAGIIPARAGFTRPRPRSSPSGGDHPRSRGVYFLTLPRRLCFFGSSPLARGLRRPRLPGRPRRRIIPARAGFTTMDEEAIGQPEDHPRSRGVYCHGRHPRSGFGGSSPLARGLPRGGRLYYNTCGIIPARAGFTSTTRRSRGTSRDHPRSRGVYPMCSPSVSRSGGSSPLARGLLPRRGNSTPRGRIIPARAGFTLIPPSSYAFPADHPRSRGVYLLNEADRRFEAGSSPLARGLPLVPGPAPAPPRIIPARAGFTPRPKPGRNP